MALLSKFLIFEKPMPTIKNTHFLTVFFWLLFRQLPVSGQGVLFSSFFAEKDLSSQNITCFLQDSRGFMWIGTQDGLNCFNGKTIKIYKHDYLDPNSLADNLIINMCEDKEGAIWVATAWGISKFDPKRLLFRNFDQDQKGEGLGYKVNVYVDKKNNVWATAGSLFLFNKTSGHFEKKHVRLSSKFGNAEAPKLYSGIFEDSQRRYWVTCNDNLYRYFPEENLFTALTAPHKKAFYQPVREDPEGNLYCGSWDGGLFRINATTGRLELLEKNGLHTCYASQRLNGNKLLWHGNTLASYNQATGAQMHYIPNTDDPYSRRNDDVSALLVDAQQQLWIGYSTKGIQIVSPPNQVFKTYMLSEDKNWFPTVNSFVRGKNYAYAGSWHNYSLVRLDTDYKPLKTWKTLVPRVKEISNNISDGWTDPDGNIWFSSELGLIKFNENTEKSELFQLDSSVCKNNFFLQILPEGDSVLWLSGYFNGLTRFSLKTKTFKNWLSRERVLFWSMARDKTGMLWLANNSGILTGYDPKNNRFVEHRYTKFTENSIYSYILYDQVSDVLWIASSNGLLKVDRKTFEGRLFTEKDNLPTSQINALQFDSQHRLWMATNKGLCFYDPKQNTFKSFFSNNGLPGNVLNQLFQMQSDGKLLIGCKGGISVLQTNAIHTESFIPSILIDNIYEAGTILPIQIKNKRKTIELAYDQDNIQIEFSSNDLINSEDNQLLFRLEGFDNKWHTAQNGIVNYSNLAPGKYLFHVSGIHHGGIRSKQDDYLAILIHPPVWKTTWFILIVILLLFSITLLAARYVFTRNFREKILILEKEQAIEKERSRISQDMHDELGSGLTKISIMSEVAMKQLENPDKAKNQLETISSSSRELVDNLQDIIWILNSRNDSLENLCAYLQEYVLKYFEAFDIHVRVDFPEAIVPMKLSEDQRRNVLLVFKESFNNISKHSGCTQVNLSMRTKGRKVMFLLTDNGKGFDKKNVRHFANGLLNMKKRMLSINGSFEITSSPNQGTRSDLSFEA